MFDLTPSERRVILFLAGIALAGLGISFGLKINSRIERMVKIDPGITKLNLNKADYQELILTRIITPRLAKRIIEYRNSRGVFQEIEELKEIKGIGDYRYEKLKDLFFVK